MKLGVALLCLLFVQPSWGQDHSAQGDALWMLQRLTSVKWPANSSVVQQMAAKISAGDLMGAADIAASQPQFLNVTVKEMALQMSTREETVGIPLNDFAADFMGVARDGTDARELLTGNFHYEADMTKLPSGVTLPAVSPQNDDHYTQLEKLNVDIGAVLKRVNSQMIEDPNNNAMANPDPAGVLTSQAFLAAHAIKGTNRRLVQFAFREFMCTPIQQWADTSASDARIGRDVDRFPGGDHMKYETSCKGCHSVMDGFRGAFAKWDISGKDNSPIYSSSVVGKMNQNGNVYSGGYITTDDSWVNNATGFVNAPHFGWRGNGSGNGAHSFGVLLANSERFSQCMAQHVFQAVCQYQPSQSAAENLYNSLGLQFEQNNYNLKKLFESVATNPNCRMN